MDCDDITELNLDSDLDFNLNSLATFANFFVNFAVSEEPNKWVLLKMLRDYLKANTDVKELVYFRRGNHQDFKRIHLRRSKNG